MAGPTLSLASAVEIRIEPDLAKIEASPDLGICEWSHGEDFACTALASVHDLDGDYKLCATHFAELLRIRGGRR